MGDTSQILDLINERLEKVNLKLIINNESDCVEGDLDEIESKNTTRTYNQDENNLFHINHTEERNSLNVTMIPKEDDVVYDRRGNHYRIEQRLFDSSDGIIYRMDKHSTCKVYKENQLTIDLYKKLNYMIEEEVQIKGVKWPLEFLFNNRDEPEIVGYRMEDIDNYGKQTLKDIVDSNTEHDYSVDTLETICFNLLTIMNKLQTSHFIFDHVNLNDILILNDQIEMMNIDHYSYNPNSKMPLFNIPDANEPKQLMIYQKQFLQVCRLYNDVLKPIAFVQCEQCKKDVFKDEIAIKEGTEVCNDCKSKVKCNICNASFDKVDTSEDGDIIKCVNCKDRIQCELCDHWYDERDLVIKEIDGDSVKVCTETCSEKDQCDICKRWFPTKEVEYDKGKIKCKETCMKLINCKQCDKLVDEADIEVENGISKCKYCINKSRCEACNTLLSNDDLTLDTNGILKCNTCINKGTCSSCGELFIKGSLGVTEDLFCETCRKLEPCHICNQLFNTEDLNSDDGKIKCKTCLNKRSCRGCNELFDKSELKLDFRDFTYKCSECLKVECGVCKRRFNESELKTDDGIRKCEVCLEKVPCDYCNELYRLDELEDAHGKIKCKSCLDKFMLPCDICSFEFDVKDLTLVGTIKKCNTCLNEVKCDVCNRSFNQSEIKVSNGVKKCPSCIEKIECDCCKDLHNIEDLEDSTDGKIMCKGCLEKVVCEWCNEPFNESELQLDSDGKKKCKSCFKIRKCLHCGEDYLSTGGSERNRVCQSCEKILERVPCNRCRKHRYVLTNERYTPFLKETKLCKQHFKTKFILTTCQKCDKDYIQLKSDSTTSRCKECESVLTRSIIALKEFVESIKTGKRKNK